MRRGLRGVRSDFVRCALLGDRDAGGESGDSSSAEGGGADAAGGTAKAILTGALKRLATGGRLVYSTCSLEPEECERVVDAVAAAGVRRVPVEGLVAELAAQGILLAGWSWTRRCGMERCGRCRECTAVMVFFAVVLERE